MKHLRLAFSLLFSIFFLSSNAQKSELIKSLEICGIRGIQISKTFPILKSGFQLNGIVGKKVSPFFEIGLGVGYMQLESESFTPLFMQLKGNKKAKENGFFFSTAIGFSKGVSEDFSANENTEFEGGVYVAPKLGYMYVVNEKLMFYCSSSYTVQKAELHNLHERVVIHTEPLTIDLFSISIGFNIY